jgi:predicted PhzF superfamily epimerase YddE/YHI9
MAALMALDLDSVIATAKGGNGCDFVSRAFAPKEGLPEDPVCGSAHLTLAPYWSNRLGKKMLRALQLSSRGGELFCRLEGDTVQLAGRCAPYLAGNITL